MSRTVHIDTLRGVKAWVFVVKRAVRIVTAVIFVVFIARNCDGSGDCSVNISHLFYVMDAGQGVGLN